jgi:cytochrome P450
LKINTDITVLAFRAVQELRVYPNILRPAVGWFLPACRVLRSEVRKARKIIEPIVQKRRDYKAACLREQAYDPTVTQLTIALSAMHNTSDFLTQLVFDLCERPNLIEDLRQEIISVRKKHPWGKATIHHLKLMDSVMKESQRLKPTGLGECLTDS